MKKTDDMSGMGDASERGNGTLMRHQPDRFIIYAPKGKAIAAVSLMLLLVAVLLALAFFLLRSSDDASRPASNGTVHSASQQSKRGGESESNKKIAEEAAEETPGKTAGGEQGGVADNSTAITLTDSRGKIITLAQPPQRIVSLLPSITESLCTLSETVCAERLIAIDRYSNWPVEITRQLPVVGGGIDPNIEAIASMKPDVVLGSNASRSLQRLESLGLVVVALDAQTLQQSLLVLQRLEQLLALPAGTAQTVWQRTWQRIDQTAAELPDSAHGLRVYYEVSPVPHAAGETSFIGELLQQLGAENIVPPELGPFPQLNPEYIAAQNPEVIFVSQANADALAARPGWQRIRAVQTGHICAITPAQNDTMARPGPRMAEGIQVMADCLSGKLSPGRKPS